MSQLDYSTSKAKYQHLSLEKRLEIQVLLKHGEKPINIAKELCVHRSTICREIRRGEVKQCREVKIKPTFENYYTQDVKKEYFNIYSAHLAQEKATANRLLSARHYKIFQDISYTTFIEQSILFNSALVSPDTANALARERGYKTVSTKTLYNWIDGGLLKVTNLDLLLKVKRKPIRNKIEAQKRKYGKSIDERAENINNRTEFGHFEGDSIVGKDHIGQIITIVERKLRVGFMFKFDKMSADNIVSVIDWLENNYGEHFKKVFKSITFDNGSEFAYNDKMMADGRLDVYYAHAYHSYERGSNENYNGIIRRFFPKGTDFNSITQESLNRVNHWINTIPRKILGYKTAKELFERELEKICFKGSSETAPTGVGLSA